MLLIKEVLRVRTDKLSLHWGGQDAQYYVAKAGKEETFSNRELAKSVALLTCELKGVSNNVDCGRVLFKQELKGGVIYNGAAQTST